VLWGALLAGRATAIHAEESAWFTGNWGGVRDNLAERGLDIEFVATTDIMAIVDGGLDRGVEAPANFELVFTLDTATAGWWTNSNFLVYFLGNSGGDPSARVRDLQVTSNIEADNTFKFFEASYEHHFVDARVSILVGLHDRNSEFYVLEHAGLFVHSSLGNGVEVSQVGPSFFPTTALAARLRVSWADNGYLERGIRWHPRRSG
jgi:porin